MDPKDVSRLEALRDELRDNLIFGHIATLLIQEEVINRDDLQIITSFKTDTEQIETLLEILPKKGPNAFKIFVSVLKRDYQWLADKLSNCNAVDSGIFTSKPKPLTMDVTPEVMNMVRKNYRVAQGWTSLAHSLGLSSCIPDIRMRMLVYQGKCGDCVQSLLEEWKGTCPAEANIGKLISALKQEGFNDIADNLEARFG